VPLLRHDFATDFPELALPWTAEEAPEPRLLVLNEPLAASLGLDVDWLRSPAGVRFLVGNEVPDGAVPVAQAYAGHQFGGFSPRLGDGRALLLGELATPEGPLVDLHLKGSGRTPFARGGDGRAVVGPMLREFLISEAMHALGIPTTRSLAVVATGRQVQRETALPGAVLARVARSHLRVGSFQYARATGDVALLRRLADHAISRHHPEAAGPERYVALYRAVVRVQAELVARWMGVGFVHGVMNTDNMTISGETIDYGPCAFVDGYHPGAVFSSIDHEGRYAFGNQPAIAQWNLARFAEAILPLLADDEESAIAVATEALQGFVDDHRAAWSAVLAAKLGVGAADALDLGTDLLELMAGARADFTTTFRGLAEAARGNPEPVREVVLDLPRIDGWLARWRDLLPDATVIAAANPRHVPRNHLTDRALRTAEAGDLSEFEELLAAVRAPWAPADPRFAEPAPAGFEESFQTFCGT